MNKGRKVNFQLPNNHKVLEENINFMNQSQIIESDEASTPVKVKKAERFKVNNTKLSQSDPMEDQQEKT